MRAKNWFNALAVARDLLLIALAFAAIVYAVQEYLGREQRIGQLSSYLSKED